MNKNNIFIITAADGNATAIKLLESSLARKEYADNGTKLMSETKKYNVEQCGFLIASDNHFEMSGGEFCGNAARSAAMLLYQIKGGPNFEFTMSGFPNPIKATVKATKDNKYDVTCVFPGLKTQTTPVQALGKKAILVDLGGIVHVVIEDEFPTNDYEAQHRQIIEDLNLTSRDAVGVCWINRKDDIVIMHPVVWVRDIDSFFYEGSCGSGTIAVGKVTNVNSVVQPTGQVINVTFNSGAVHLYSSMELTRKYYGN
jgi:diaminopimelate epimerase